MTALCAVGNVVHEIGHAVGLYHEHVRHDRDTYVWIDLSNVQAAAHSNFYSYGTESEDANAYDYGSIMHYDQYAFAVDPSRPTIVPLVTPTPEIGQRDGLSIGDRLAIARLYP